MKIIFLDIDGVLNNEVFPNAFWAILKQAELKREQAKSLHKIVMRDDYGNYFCPTATNALAYLIENTKAKIVISSTWRFMGEEKIKQMWIDRKLPGEVIGVTGRHDTRHRGEEINDWIDNWTTENAEIMNYVIIDDDDDMMPHQKNCFIHTNPTYGLTFDDAAKAIEILGEILHPLSYN